MDSQQQAFYIPEDKKEHIHLGFAKVINTDFIPFKELASLNGLLISIYKAVGPLIRLLTSSGFQWINKCGSW